MTVKNISDRGDPTVNCRAKGLLHKIGEGQCVQDVVENPNEPLPDFMSEQDVMLLLEYLPEERWHELDPHIALLADSIPDKPVDFEGWDALRKKDMRDSPDKTIATIMMIALAGDIFRHWLSILRMLDDPYITLKKIAANRLIWLAKTSLEKNVAERIRKEVDPS